MAQLLQDEEGLRSRIRGLLLRYAEAYLTCDHRKWTEEAVAQLLSESLRKVPIVDPTSLWIVPEPFDTLQQLYSLSQLSLYDEGFVTSASALAFLKDASKKGRGETRSERAALVDDPNPQKNQRIEEAALTTRAIRSTPKLPSGSRPAILQNGPFCLINGAKHVDNEDPDQVPLQSGEILNVNWQTSMGERRHEVQAMLKRMLDLSGRVSSQAKLGAFDEGDIQLYRPDSPFIPIFPRKALSAQKRGSDVENEITSFAKLSAYLPHQVSTEELEKELFNDDMRVIDDWGAFMVSSPSTLSTPSSSQLDRKIDMLFNDSSPTTDPYPAEMLEAAKMDIVQIPRSRRPGGGAEWKSITDNHCFTSFVLKTLHGGEPMKGELGKGSCPQERISSVAGEAPCSESSATLMTVDEANTDDDISKLYVEECVKDFWSRETLDEKDTMLMDVPNLPPPNIHRPSNIFLSRKLRDLCLVSESTSAALPHSNTAALPHFLKKVKGLQPLNVALSWIAFSTKGPLPSHAELAGVSPGFGTCDSEMGGVSAQAVNGLIEASERAAETDIAIGLGASCLFEDTPDKAPRLASSGPDMILTRRERWRLAGVMDCEIRSETDAIKDVSNEQKFSARMICPDPKITFPFELSPNSPANDFMKVDNSLQQPICSEIEGSGSPSLQLIEAARRISNVTGAMNGYNQIPVPTSHAGWHEDNILAFAELRSKSLPHLVAPPKIEPVLGPSKPCVSSGRPRHVPSDLFTPTTLRLPPQVNQPNAVHHYMASLDVLQKQVLVRALRAPNCSVELIERDNLHGADLIVDPFTAILYRSLFSLPADCDEAIGLVSKLSWSFDRLVIVLEAFPPSHAMRSTDHPDPLYAYTPPILKAIKRLRRGVDMVEADQEKREETVVLYAFANSTQEAALITRYIGEMAQGSDQTGGVFWEDRSWLDRVDEDEENLAAASGMNRFASAVVLSQMTLDDFIAFNPDDRHHAFSSLIGAHAISSFNADLVNRILQSSSDIHHHELTTDQ